VQRERLGAGEPGFEERAGVAIGAAERRAVPQRRRPPLASAIEVARDEHRRFGLEAELRQPLARDDDATHEIVRAQEQPAIAFAQAEQTERAGARAQCDTVAAAAVADVHRNPVAFPVADPALGVAPRRNVRSESLGTRPQSILAAADRLDESR